MKDRELLKLVNLADRKYFLDDNIVPARADYVKKREIDRSTLYSFDSPFQLLHADIGSLEFLGKNATVPQYALVIVDLHSSKVYVYSMKFTKQIFQKMKLFYNEVRSKRKKGKRMRLQGDNEFQQVKIKSLNDENNVENLIKSVKYGLSPKEIESQSLKSE